jgi:uncharacterized protein YjbJ (UPF0337 family)
MELLSARTSFLFRNAHVNAILGPARSVRRRTDGSSRKAQCPGITEGIHMDWDRIQGNWKQVAGKAKEQWGKLTDDDVDVVAGRRGQLVGKIQERYGVARDEAERQLSEWQRKATGAWFVTDEDRT